MRGAYGGVSWSIGGFGNGLRGQEGRGGFGVCGVLCLLGGVL